MGRLSFRGQIDGLKQAEYFLNAVGVLSGLLLVLHFEANPTGPNMPIEEARAFVTHIKAVTGVWPGFYCGHYFKEALGMAVDPVIYKAFINAWLAAVQKNDAAFQAAGAPIAQAVNALLGSGSADAVAVLDTMTSLGSAWHSAGATAERSGNFDAFVAAYATYDSAFSDYILSRPGAPVAALDLGKALAAFTDVTYTVLNEARGTPLASITYQYLTPPTKPATHTATVALSELFRGGKRVLYLSGNDTGQRTSTWLSGAQLTGNFTASIYNSLPPGAVYGRS